MKKIFILLMLLFTLFLGGCEYIEMIQSYTVSQQKETEIVENFVEIDSFKVSYYALNEDESKAYVGYLNFAWRDDLMIFDDIRWYFEGVNQTIYSINTEKYRVMQFYFDETNQKLKAILLDTNEEFVTKIDYKTIIYPLYKKDPKHYKYNEDYYYEIEYTIKEKESN